MVGRSTWPCWSPISPLVILLPGAGGPRIVFCLCSGCGCSSFWLISCFLDLTMAELLSVSLLKNAGGWLVLPGDLEPILLQGSDTTGQFTWC